MFRAVFASLLLAVVLGCGGGDDDDAVDAASADGALAFDVRVIDSRIADARTDAPFCDEVACKLRGDDHRCDSTGTCTNSCLNDLLCSRGYQCDTGICKCEPSSCGAIMEGNRCVNNQPPVPAPATAVTLCTPECGANWPPCQMNYQCQGGGCLRIP